MEIRDELPQSVREIENLFIPMPDGTRLAARIWLPESAEGSPVPAILEYIPYRKRDLKRARDETLHRYFAGHGYAAIRVDLRGSGDSDGILTDEYLEQELADGEAIIAWLAEQSWCDGQVGMIGISWGGFNGLQIAARRPPGLKAVVTWCSTDDRYADDVHYMGGCLLGDNLSWASVMLSYNSCPPDPEIVGPRWRDMWMERLDKSGLWLKTWLEHQHRGSYWKHGSICEDYADIEVPVFAGSGWADGYSNAVFRLLSGLDTPRKGLIGPWSHTYPHLGKPGPAIGFLQECVRWWDHWMKDRDTGIMDEPMLRVWMQDTAPPSTGYADRPGRWVAEPSWPSENITPTTLRMEPHRLVEAAPGEATAPMEVHSPVSLGLFAGKWCSYSAPPDLPDDQRFEDGGALVFDTEPLKDAVEIMGAPVVDLVLASDRPVAQIAARLCDIRPDQRSTRVTYGLLNLTHRDGHEHPEALEPNHRYRVRLVLNDVAQTFPVGHKIRLSLSTTYWPLAWPAPKPVVLSVFGSASSLTLPVRPPRDDDDALLHDFGPDEGAPPAQVDVVEGGEEAWRVIRDLAADSSCLEVVHDAGRRRIEAIDLEYENKSVERYYVQHDDFDSISGETIYEKRFERDGWSVRTRARTLLTSTEDEFRLRAELDAWEGGTRVFCRSWDERIPRKLV